MPRPYLLHEIHRPFGDDRVTNVELIAKTLSNLIIDHPLSMERNHPLVNGLVHPKKSVDFINSMTERSVRKESPVHPYLLFRGIKSFDRLVGMAVVIESVPLHYRREKYDLGNQIDITTTQIQVVLGTGGAESFTTACEQVKDTTTAGDVVAIEPGHGVQAIHDSLESVFGPFSEGYFSSGLKFNRDKNRAYGIVAGTFPLL